MSSDQKILFPSTPFKETGEGGGGEGIQSELLSHHSFKKKKRKRGNTRQDQRRHLPTFSPPSPSPLTHPPKKIFHKVRLMVLFSCPKQGWTFLLFFKAQQRLYRPHYSLRLEEKKSCENVTIFFPAWLLLATRTISTYMQPTYYNVQRPRLA